MCNPRVLFLCNCNHDYWQMPLFCTGVDLAKESHRCSSSCRWSIPGRYFWKWTWTNAGTPPRCIMSVRCPLLSSIADARSWACARARIPSDWNRRFNNSTTPVTPRAKQMTLPRTPCLVMYEIRIMLTITSLEWSVSSWFCTIGISISEESLTRQLLFNVKYKCWYFNEN